MHRKDYQRPEMKVVELQHRCCLLAGSGKGGDAMDNNSVLNVTYDEEEI